MTELPPTALANAAETRRREMPASVALVILTGGIAAAIMGGSAPVGWAAVMSLLLIFDTELYRRLDAAERPIEGPIMAGLAAWAFASSTFYAVLPLTLWLNGAAAGAAAAMVLWVAGVVRHFSKGQSGAWPIAIAGAAPPALSLLFAPLLMASMTPRPDWDLAVIAAIGGAALMVYVTAARLSAVEAEQALRRAQRDENLQDTLAQLLLSNDTTAAFLMDVQGRIVAVSGSVPENLQRDDLEGLHLEDIVPLPLEKWRDAFARALKGECVRHNEEDLMLPGGRTWFDWETRPWRGPDGQVRGVYLAGRDITSLVATRAEAARSENLLRMALGVSGSVVWDVDYKTQTITWHGDENILGVGFTFEEFHNSTTKIIHADDRLLIRQYFLDIAEGKSGCVEHRVMKADGSVTWVETWAQRVLGRTGALRKFIMLSRDITERKRREAAFIAAMQRAEAALRAKRALFQDIGSEAAASEATVEHSDISVEDMYDHLAGLMEEMDARDGVLAETLASLRAAREAAEAASVSKSQFLASMSHELRTPLNAIIGYSEILLEEAEADGRATDIADIQRVIAAARQLLHLINDILDLSKIEAGRMEVCASEFDVAAMVEEAVATVRHAVEKNGNAVRVELAPNLGEAHSDSFKLNQCLLNLLANAAKFTKDGELVVSARRQVTAAGDFIEIDVRDTGIGMTEDQLARLFNAFTQADASTARRFGGTGLGLAITRRMMQLLGGDVSVVSAHGAGSTFTLRVPAHFAGATTPERIDSALATGQGKDRVVLLIDDEESARDLTTRALARLGFYVRTASTGRDGVRMARDLSPSLILLDINLTDMSGWDVLSTLQDEGSEIPVIIHSVEDDRKRALGAGACEHLVKPADRDVLAAAALRFARASAAAHNTATNSTAIETKKTA